MISRNKGRIPMSNQTYQKIAQRTLSDIAIEKENILKSAQQYILDTLLTKNPDSKTKLNYKCPIFEHKGEYLVYMHTFISKWYVDLKGVSVVDLADYVHPLGINIEVDESSHDIYAFFNQEFIVDYEPQTQTIKEWFGLHTVQVGEGPKDRVKLALLDLYPDYSDEELIQYVVRKGHHPIYNNNGLRYEITVDTCDDHFMALYQFALRANADARNMKMPFKSANYYQYQFYFDFTDGR